MPSLGLRTKSNHFRSVFCVAALVAGLGLGAATAADPEHRTIQVNGTTLEYVDQGTGQPVVFVHGSIADLRSWENQREAVAAEFRFIAYNRRYFGEQPWQDNGETFGDATDAADLVAFVEALNLGPVHLVSHSGGGGVAMVAMLARPDLFRSAVYIEPGGLLAQLLVSDAGKAANQGRVDVQAPASAAVKEGKLNEAVELFLDATFNRPGAFAEMSPDQQAMHLANARTLELRSSSERPTVDCTMMSGSSVPTAVIAGDQTLAYFVAVADEVARCLPNAQRVVLPGASHDATNLMPDELNALVLGHLRANSGS